MYPVPSVSCCAQESEGILGTSLGFEYIRGLRIQSQMRKVQMVPVECRLGEFSPLEKKEMLYPDGEVKVVSILGVFQWEDIIPTPDWQFFLT